MLAPAGWPAPLRGGKDGVRDNGSLPSLPHTTVLHALEPGFLMPSQYTLILSHAPPFPASPRRAAPPPPSILPHLLSVGRLLQPVHGMDVQVLPAIGKEEKWCWWPLYISLKAGLEH